MRASISRRSLGTSLLVIASLAILCGYFVAKLDQADMGWVVPVSLPILAAAVGTGVVVKRWSRRWGWNGAITTTLIGIWLAAQLWNAALPDSSPYAGISLRWKNYLGAVVLVVWFALVVSDRRKLYVGRLNSVALISGSFFVAESALSFMLHGSLNWPLLAMYAGWIAYAYLLVPALFARRPIWLFAIRLWLVLLLAVMAWRIGTGIYAGEIYRKHTREISLGFNAIQIYGRGLAGGITCAMVLLANATKRRTRMWWLATAVVLSVLLALSRSRGNWLYVLSLVFTLGLYATKRSIRVLAYVVLGIALLFACIAVLRLDWSELNAISSGRLDLFQQAMGAYLWEANVADLFLGAPFVGAYDKGNWWYGGASGRVFEAREGGFDRAHIENGYLTLLLSHGILGLVLFVIPLLHIYVRLRGSLRSVGGVQRLNVILAIGSLNGLAVSSLTSTHVPSFGNPMAIFLPVIWLPVLAHLSRRVKSCSSMSRGGECG